MRDDSLPSISEQDIREMATASSFERGMGYFVRGAILDPVREGNVLRARCEGSMPLDYHLQVDLDETGVTEAWCSCPYSYGGICKHLVALLLTWVRQPDTFAVYDDLVTTLEALPKETLVALVAEMVQQDPALYDLLARYREQPESIPTPSAPRPHRVSAAEYSGEIAYIIGEGADWYHMDELMDGLYTVERTAEGFARRGEFTNAAIIYTELLRGCVEGIEYCDDSSGSMGDLGQACAETLQEIVPQTDWDEAERRSWLRDMFELCVNDMGGYGFEEALSELVIATYRPADVETLEAWIHESLGEASHKPRSDYRRRGLISMLLDLYAREGRHEAYLTLCAEEGQRLALCEKLVDLGRAGEAMRVVRREPLPDHKAWHLVERLEQAGHEAFAIEVAEAALPEARGWPLGKLGNWLLERYERQNDRTSALEIHLARFRASPNFALYQSIAEQARELGRWEQLKPGLDQVVEERGSHSLKIEMALADGDLPRAMEIVERSGAAINQTWTDRVAHRAAESAEHYPWAVAYYEHQAEKHIAGKRRHLYQEALKILKTIRQVYRRHNAPGEWDAFIADVRKRHRGKKVFLEVIEAL